jgi:hypothetical protein
MSDYIPVFCTFKFLCDKQWSDLNEIAKVDNIRYCEQCTKLVFMCDTYDELAEHAAGPHCVAVRESEIDHLLE